MRKWLLVSVAVATFGFTLVPAAPAGATLNKTGVWVGACVGEIDVTLSPKPSFTSLANSVSASLSGPALTCVVAGLEYSGTSGAVVNALLGNMTSVTCEAGLLQGGSGGFALTNPSSAFPARNNDAFTVLEFNATAATLGMTFAPYFNAAAELVPLGPTNLVSACMTPPSGSITIPYEAVMVFEDPTVDTSGVGG